MHHHHPVRGHLTITTARIRSLRLLPSRCSHLRLLFLTTLLLAPPSLAIPPGQVAVLYNSSNPESRELAEIYAAARDIPPGNLAGIAMPQQADISRAQYETRIRDPLRNLFDEKGWWRRAKEPGGDVTLPVENRIRVIAIMRGTPLRIKPTPREEDAPPPDPQNPVAHRDEASVDSEIALFGLDGVPAEGVLQNRYFKSKLRFTDEHLPFMVLTARIDGPGHAVSQRLILDAVETEKTGLWGNATIDIANFHPEGDAWLETIIKANQAAGIPTVVDRFKPTLPTHYPMDDTALYYGWYDHHVSGPFLNPRFQLRRGAVAVHIHSFSAAQLTNPARNWSAPILAAGAAATLGNVHEPYLHLSHHLDVFHERLLRGFTLVEAAWAAIPAASWQAVVIGDPLYRPFAHFPDGGKIIDADIDFRALAMAKKNWPHDDTERREQLTKAVDRTQSATIAEALALEYLEAGDTANTRQWLTRANELGKSPTRRIRLAMHRAAIHRHNGDKGAALDVLRHAAERFADHPETKALQAWIDILDPPPPEPAEAGNGQ